MTSIFFETMGKAISDYRLLLRRYLPQAERQAKLIELNLKDPAHFKSEMGLYKLGLVIIEDIEKNMKTPNKGYYSYSGISMFAEYLKEFLGNYEVDGQNIVHRAQRASKALIQAIQLVSLPKDQLDEKIAQKLSDCSKIIATYGSKEQILLHRSNLERQRAQNEKFYSQILDGYRECLNA